MVDNWAETNEDNKDTAVVILDQTAAYNIIEHKLLIDKLKILGMDNHSIQYFTNYLKGRTHVVTVDGETSSELHTGPLSVVQCVLKLW